MDIRPENSVISAFSPTVQPAPENKSEPSGSTPTNQNTTYSQSDNPQVNALRQILTDKPELQTKVKNAVGNHVDPLDEEVLSLFMRRHIQSYLEVRAASGEVLNPFEMFKVVQTQLGSNPGGPLFIKILKGFSGCS